MTKELIEAWQVPGAYVGIPYLEPEVTDEDGGPIWTVPIECNGGDAQVADVCGGSKREALARAHAVCRAIQGGPIYDGEWVAQIDRLRRSANEEDWEAAEALQTLSSRLQSLSDTVERLVEALRPFARAADEWDGEPAALCVEFCAYDGPRMNPSTNVAAFRHASAIVAAHQEHSHEQ